MFLVSFGSLSCSILYPLLLSIFTFAFSYTHNILSFNKLNFTQYSSEMLIIYSLGDILCGALEMIICCRNRPPRSKRMKIEQQQKQLQTEDNNTNTNTNNNNNSFLFSSPSKTPIALNAAIIPLTSNSYTLNSSLEKKIEEDDPNYKIKVRLMLIIAGLLKIGGNVFILLEKKIKGHQRLMIFASIRIFFTSFLCRIIFKERFVYHHVIGIMLIFIGMIISTCLYMIILYSTVDLMYLIYVLFEIIFYSILEVIEKVLMDRKYISPYMLLLYEGVVTLVIYLISLVSLSFVACPMSLEGTFCHQTLMNIKDAVHTLINNRLILMLVLLCLVFISFVNLFRVLTNKTYSPTHRTVADVMNAIYFWIVLCVQRNLDIFGKSGLLSFIGNFIAFIGCLLFHEVIILKCCGLDYYTKGEIQNRQRRESKYSDISKLFSIEDSTY